MSQPWHLSTLPDLESQSTTSSVNCTGMSAFDTGRLSRDGGIGRELWPTWFTCAGQRRTRRVDLKQPSPGHNDERLHRPRILLRFVQEDRAILGTEDKRNGIFVKAGDGMPHRALERDFAIKETRMRWPQLTR